MPQGDKTAYTAKQKRKAAHIAEGYRKRGAGPGRAAAPFPMPTIPAPAPPPVASLAEPATDTTFLMIDFDPEEGDAGYSVVTAPHEEKARQLADAAARSAGRILIDVVTYARLRALLDHAAKHPPDHAAALLASPARP